MSEAPSTPSRPRSLSGSDDPPLARPVLRPIPRWVIAIGVSAMTLIAVGAVWLLLGIGVAGDKLDAIRTGGTLGVGLGGVVVLWLAVRRQRSTELDLLHKYDLAEAGWHDATERRITELYTKAVEQLGSEKAPVRLGGLYALERLAQNTPRLRQTIVNVICAYLTYTLPITARASRALGRRHKIRPGQPISPKSQLTTVPQIEPSEIGRQEREVRLTAQRILAAHLQPGPEPGHPAETFWNGIDLDLTGAILIDLDHCRMSTARFDGVTHVHWGRAVH